MPSSPLRVHGPALVSNVAATKYTVPANSKFVLRHIHVQNPSVAPVDFTMSIGADAAAVRLYDGYPIGPDSVLDVWVYFALEETEIIQALAGTNNILTLTLDGDLRTL
jgi:hypothetical protein